MTDPPIEVLHVGSASRDLTEDDPRGWRLGGGVTYAALTTARLGLRTAALIGGDPAAATAIELELLRDAGVDVVVVALETSPVFRNVETPQGRIQACIAPGEPIPVTAVPRSWVSAGAWSFVPVAGELGAEWASTVPEHAYLVLGWQGWLRRLPAGRTVQRRTPGPLALLERANLVGVSRHDLARGTGPAQLSRLLGPDARLLVTDGDRGGTLWPAAGQGTREPWPYEAIVPPSALDPTGAGDVFLAALLAATIQPALVGHLAPEPHALLAFAAAAASLAIERPGVLGIPDRSRVRARLDRADQDLGTS